MSENAQKVSRQVVRDVRMRSICFSLSGRVAEEGIDDSAPDSLEEDILSIEYV
jgi:hypothetical protein